MHLFWASDHSIIWFYQNPDMVSSLPLQIALKEEETL